MAAWPRDFGLRPSVATDNRKKTSKSIYQQERGLGTIDITGNRLGAGTLIPQDGQLVWSFMKAAPNSKSNFSSYGFRVGLIPSGQLIENQKLYKIELRYFLPQHPQNWRSRKHQRNAWLSSE